jgi:hypothetical protein
MGAANKAWNSAWCFFYTGLRKPRPDQSSAGLISLDAVWLWSKCRPAFVKHAVWLSSESTRASHPSRFQRTSMRGRNQKVSAWIITIVQLGEFPGTSS